MKRKKEVFWGMLLILGAIYLLASRMGFFFHISLFRVVFTIFLVGILIENLAERSFGGILFSLAFLGILYDRQLGIEALTPVPILVAALLGTIGLNIVFPKKKHLRLAWEAEGEHWEEIPEMADFDGEMHCSVSFNSTTKYINSPHFRKAVLKSSFGSMAVYFDQAMIEGDYAEIWVGISFGNIELYIPRDWKAEINVDTAFGEVKEGYRAEGAPQNRKALVISGDISFGGLEIHYI